MTVGATCSVRGLFSTVACPSGPLLLFSLIFRQPFEVGVCVCVFSFSESLSCSVVQVHICNIKGGVVAKVVVNNVIINTYRPNKKNAGIHLSGSFIACVAQAFFYDNNVM